MVPKQQHTIIFGGGLDLVTPPLRVDPGRLLEIKNYECDLNEGYRQAAGFERFDGRQSPTEANFFAIFTENTTGTFQIGETITGGTSSATATVLSAGVQGIYLVEITGTFQESETITGGTSAATATTSSVAFANITLSEDEEFNDIRFLKEEYYKDFIQTVPGTGPIRGVFRHEAITLAVRDFNGSEARMYRATTAGWTQITQSHIVFYDTRIAALPLPGTTLNDGAGNTAILHRDVPITVSGTSGYIVLRGYTTGFAVSAMIRENTTNIATVTEAATAVTLQPGGKHEWESHNFTGAEEFYRVYTTNGVNAAMEYDPTEDVLTPIYSDQLNRPLDIPTYVSVYRNHLFLGFNRGLVRNSEPGDPMLFDAAAGTLEIAVGAPVTGFDAVASALLIATRRTTRVLKGETADNFVLDIASARTGAIAYTMQHIGTTYMLDDRGIIEIGRVQAFGDFENATVSRLVQPLLNELRNDIIVSGTNLSNNIYRLYTGDGRGISLTFQEGNVSGFGVYDYETSINVMSSSEDENGNERIFFGGDDGYVFELEKGRSFDGVEKEAWMRTVFQYLESPTIRKRFFRAFFDAELSGRSSISITAEYSNGGLDANPTNLQTDTVNGFRGGWDIGLWDRALFDATIVSDAYIDLTGTGDSISLIFYSNSAKDDILTLKDVVYHYKSRRGIRSRR